MPDAIPTPTRFLCSRQLAGYAVFLTGDTVTVIDDDGIVTKQQVDGLGTFVAQATDLRCGWGQFADGTEVIYLYDGGDDTYGYVLSLQDAWCSRWGWAPAR